MMTDPIADMLTRIRNAVRIERPNVDVPASKVKRGLAEVLKREGYIWDWKESEEDRFPVIHIDLKYGPNGERVIRHIKRVSKPGRRVYNGSNTTAAHPQWIGNIDREYESWSDFGPRGETAKSRGRGTLRGVVTPQRLPTSDNKVERKTEKHTNRKPRRHVTSRKTTRYHSQRRPSGDRWGPRDG